MTDKTRIPLGWDDDMMADFGYAEELVNFLNVTNTEKAFGETIIKAFAAALNPVSQSDETLSIRIAEIARDMRDKPAEDYCEAIEPLIAAHRNAATEEVESRLEAEQRAMEVVAAENTQLRALMEEAKEDLRAYVVNEYPHADKYPSQAAKLERDMDIVVRIEAALQQGGQ